MSAPRLSLSLSLGVSSRGEEARPRDDDVALFARLRTNLRHEKKRKEIEGGISQRGYTVDIVVLLLARLTWCRT